MNERDPKRRFSKAERIALANAADWRSEVSGEPLGEDFHVDHIYPHSKGGHTHLRNAQVLTPLENLRKGNNVTRFSYERLRSWQQRFVDSFRRREGVDYLLAALPGTGKTIAALYCASEFLLSGYNRKLIVVVPTDTLREQWRNVAYKHFGLNLKTRDFKGTLRNDGELNEDLHGVVTTYAAVAASPINFQAIANKHDIFSVLDELHHLAQIEDVTKGWGWATCEAFSGPRIFRRLATSGTPIRTDGERIPFLTIKPGSNEYHMDFTYDYPAALRDRVVRRVTFHRYGGRVDLYGPGGAFSLDTDDDLGLTLTNLRLRRLLKTEEFAKGLLIEANEKLTKVRLKKPNAGGLILAIDSDHAGELARWLMEVTGEDPDIVVTNDDVANSSIESYEKSNRKWIIAVKMVSEGVDIKRLMVLAYMTTTTTEIFFRQAIGRIIRHDGSKNDRHAHCIIPSDPRFHEYASTIEKFQALVPEDKTPKPPKSRKPGEPPLPILTVGATPPEFDGMVVAGDSFDADTSTVILDAAEAASITPDEAAIAWSVFMAQDEKQKDGTADSHRPEKHPEDELEDIRKRVARKIVALAYALKVINENMNHEEKGIGIAKVTNWVADQSKTPLAPECNLKEIREKEEWVLKELQSCRISR